MLKAGVWHVPADAATRVDLSRHKQQKTFRGSIRYCLTVFRVLFHQKLLTSHVTSSQAGKLAALCSGLFDGNPYYLLRFKTGRDQSTRKTEMGKTEWHLTLLVVLLSAGSVFCQSTDCGVDGLTCHNGGACEKLGDGTPRCKCNTSWINGPTFTGAQCETPTADCTGGLWCYEAHGKCAMRDAQWAHGDGQKDCEEGGGKCHRQTMSAGTQDVEMCIGGERNNKSCNTAIGCECFSGFYGTHCEQEIIVCKRGKSGQILHWCNTQGSIGCNGETECECIDGFTGPYCESYEGFGSSTPPENDPEDTDMTIALAILVPFGIVATFTIIYMYCREKEGNPVFKPLLEDLLGGHVPNVHNMSACVGPEFVGSESPEHRSGSSGSALEVISVPES